MACPMLSLHMFLRRKKNRLGSESVQVVESNRSGYKVVKSFGASRDELELRSLERKAQQWIDDQRGPRLPFSWEKDDIITDFMSTLSNSQVRVHGPELVYGSLYDRIGYNAIDYEKFEADAAWDGLKAYITNSRMAPKKIIENYHNLWFIERAFRMNKTDLRIRPIYHRLRNRIEGHICICFTAYTIMLELERRLKKANAPFSLNQAREMTKSIYSITYTLPETKKEKTTVLKMSDEQQMLVEIAQK